MPGAPKNGNQVEVSTIMRAFDPKVMDIVWEGMASSTGHRDGCIVDLVGG
jgi:hypothetical protein